MQPFYTVISSLWKLQYFLINLSYWVIALKTQEKVSSHNHLIHLIAQSFRNSYMQTFCGNLNGDLTNWAYRLPIPLESMFYWEIYFLCSGTWKQVNKFQWEVFRDRTNAKPFIYLKMETLMVGLGGCSMQVGCTKYCIYY